MDRACYACIYLSMLHVRVAGLYLLGDIHGAMLLSACDQRDACTLMSASQKKKQISLLHMRMLRYAT